MRYYKIIDNGYILAVGTGIGGTEISEEEYTQIVGKIQSRPTPPEGKDYRLTESLEWEECDRPIEENPDKSSVGDEATEADYQEALRSLGVQL